MHGFLLPIWCARTARPATFPRAWQSLLPLNRLMQLTGLMLFSLLLLLSSLTLFSGLMGPPPRPLWASASTLGWEELLDGRRLHAPLITLKLRSVIPGLCYLQARHFRPGSGKPGFVSHEAVIPPDWVDILGQLLRQRLNGVPESLSRAALSSRAASSGGVVVARQIARGDVSCGRSGAAACCRWGQHLGSMAAAPSVARLGLPDTREANPRCEDIC